MISSRPRPLSSLMPILSKRRSMIWKRLAAFCLFAAASGAFSPAWAQVLVQRSRSDVPAVSRFFPAGIQRGRTAEIVATGERLEGLSGILGPPGLRLVKVLSVEEKQAKFELEATA